MAFNWNLMVIYLSSLLLLFTIFWMGFLVIIFLFLLFSTFKNPIPSALSPFPHPSSAVGGALRADTTGEGNGKRAAPVCLATRHTSPLPPLPYRRVASRLSRSLRSLPRLILASGSDRLRRRYGGVWRDERWRGWKRKSLVTAGKNWTMMVITTQDS